MRKQLLVCVLCVVLISTLAATSVVSAKQPPVRTYPVAGANKGSTVHIDMRTGTFVCIASGLHPGVKYYLQYHVTGRFGAAVIGSCVANHAGIVIITGKLDRTQLALVQKPGEFSIGQYVL